VKYLRKNVYELGGPWADPILWYARGVAAAKARVIAMPTSWDFYAAIHGFDSQLWLQLGYLDPTKMPIQNLQDTFWKQCQHGTWYFPPWHRGYLIAFEVVIRAEVIKLGGPVDWALPYWNYFKPNQNALPPAFASRDWPDGQGNNPLFVPQRYGPQNDGNVFVLLNQVNLQALSDPDFTGVPSGGSPGFGGVDTGFSHGGPVHGGIETQPHDYVHGLVGGEDPQTGLPGLMSDPDIAALDPIFWLHHANIDRLWEVWREHPPTHVDPTDPRWNNGPAFIGERKFAMPMPDGCTWVFTPGQMSNLKALDYAYDDVSAGPAPAPLAARMATLGFDAATAGRIGGVAVATPKNVELVGATIGSLPIEGNDIRTDVRLDKAARQKVARSLMKPGVAAAAALGPAAVPDRVFLNLENVTGLSDATAFNVYIGLPQGGEALAGSIALFGVRKASQAGGPHGGRGLTFVLEITDIVDRLHLQNALDVDSLQVRLAPIRPVSKAAKINIGRISLYRQGR
jgi:tyrosinase